MLVDLAVVYYIMDLNHTLFLMLAHTVGVHKY